MSVSEEQFSKDDYSLNDPTLKHILPQAIHLCAKFKHTDKVKQQFNRVTKECQTQQLVTAIHTGINHLKWYQEAEMNIAIHENMDVSIVKYQSGEKTYFLMNTQFFQKYRH